MILKASYYQQFDADFSLDVPAEGYGGWKAADIEIAPQHTAVVVMHAWDTGTREQFPGWRRAVEYMPRAQATSFFFYSDWIHKSKLQKLLLY